MAIQMSVTFDRVKVKANPKVLMYVSKASLTSYEFKCFTKKNQFSKAFLYMGT